MHYLHNIHIKLRSKSGLCSASGCVCLTIFKMTYYYYYLFSLSSCSQEDVLKANEFYIYIAIF